MTPSEDGLENNYNECCVSLELCLRELQIVHAQKEIVLDTATVKNVYAIIRKKMNYPIAQGKTNE